MSLPCLTWKSLRAVAGPGLCCLLLSGCRPSVPSGGAPPAGPGGFATQVVLAEAKRQAVSETLSLVASLVADEMVEVRAETEGTIEEILFEEGAPVNKGDLLIRLDESKFTNAVTEAEANFKLSQLTYDRVQRLYAGKLISQQEFDQAAATLQANQASLDLKRRQWRDTRLVAPFAGIAGGRMVSPGQVIARNTILTWVVDLDPVKAEISVPERFLGQLAVGQKLALTVAAFPGEVFPGEVYFIAPQVDPTTRTALIKARIPNPQRRLKPGMFANLDLTLRLKDQAVVIPESAVLASGDRTIIYVAGPDDIAQIRPVQLGIRQAGIVEVTRGLEGGERVVAEGIQKVRPGGKVRGGPPGGPGGPGGRPGAGAPAQTNAPGRPGATSQAPR
ncbi:MAG: hypothetical protein RJA22_2275 [Verrucomicrobiota bacterium]